MIRYVKYIFLVFGGLGLAIILFFIAQNREDLKLAWEYRPKFSYDNVAKNCPATKDHYYYPCFRKTFEQYAQQVGLTGISFGMKMAFNFMDEDKERAQVYSDAQEPTRLKDIEFALNYLDLNNIAIRQSHRKFIGFEKMYAGYLSSVRDFLEGAKKFSDNLILGLEGEEGFSSLADSQVKSKLTQRYLEIKSTYESEYEKAHAFIQSEIDEILKKHQ